MSANKIPGKTAPRIFADIALHDPRSKASYNPFKDPPPGFYESDNLNESSQSAPRCNHIYTYKNGQTSVDTDLEDSPAKKENARKVCAICQKCLWHIDVDIHYNELYPTCPSTGNPLHHFVVNKPARLHADGREFYWYGCTICRAELSICIRPKRLTHEYHELLTERGNLQRRFLAAQRKDAERPRLEAQSPIKVLEALSAYLKDSLEDSPRMQDIPVQNKRFMTSFGDDCDTLLTWLGFTKKKETKEEEDGTIAEHESWALPKPPAADPFTLGVQRVLLEDVTEELYASIRKYPEDQKRTIKYRPPEKKPFDDYMRILLGIVDYDKKIPKVRRPDVSIDYLYAGIGATQDFTPELLDYAFRRQATWDSTNSSYYYDCLTEISKKSPSNDINMYIGILASEGYSSRAEVTDAYKYLGLSTIQTLTDHDILGQFESRLDSSHKSHEADLRAKLKIIGLARGSSLLCDAAENGDEDDNDERLKEADSLTKCLLNQGYSLSLLEEAGVVSEEPFETRVDNFRELAEQTKTVHKFYKFTVVQNAEQALKWLDPTYDGTVDLSDDQILAMAAAKIADRSDHTPTAQNVVKILADSRNSDSLRSWMVGSHDFSSSDPVTEAYRFFDIPDRNAVVDLGVLQAYMDMMITDDPSKADDAPRHFTVMLNYVSGQSAQNDVAPDYENPVGLSNMGNTCYLNCLLQYFYTIKPLREMVLRFDNFKIDLSDPEYQPKKVDSQVISKLHVERTQDFVKELQKLYLDMATAPGPVVNPTWKLATLTLETGPIPISNIRRSTIGGEPPVIQSPTRTHGKSWIGALKEEGSSTSPFLSKTANSSEVTLIDADPKTPDTEPDVMALDDNGRPDRVDSPADMEEEMPDIMDPEAIPLLDPRSTPPSPPPRPPPVPPRPIGPLEKPEADKANHENASRATAEAAAQQQDVDEAMGNVLFKLQCSIRGQVQDGKSTDEIKELFYGNFLWKYMNKTTEDNDEAFSAINISLTEKPKDINAGLEGAFAIDEVILDGNRTKRFRTITKLPPIFQVYIQRQDFDHDRQDTVINKHHVQLDETIYLDRFMTIDNPALQGLREQSWAMDTRLSKLKARRHLLQNTSIGIDAPDLLDSTYQFISTHAEEISATDAVLQSLKWQSETRKADLRSISTAVTKLEEKKASLFASHTQHAYVLAAVFVHRGQGGSRGGHYWVYIRDFVNNQWRKYEDKTVTLVTDRDEIFGKTDPEVQGAPYFCVYVKQEESTNIFDAVFREKPDERMGVDDEGNAAVIKDNAAEAKSVMEWD